MGTVLRFMKYYTKMLKGKLLILLSLFCLQPIFAQNGKSKQKPNILFIMADDHTSQAWGIYGGPLEKVIKNENIRKMAANGAVLNNAFCTNSICVPSRATIMTGQYSHNNGVYTLADALNPDKDNIAKELQKAGYQTALIGKWHLKKKPSGFDHFMVMPGQGVYFDPVFKTENDWQDDGITAGKSYPGYNSDVVAEYSIKWLKARKENQPFMLMTHFKATHEPFEYPARLKDMYADVELPEPASLLDFGPETNGRTFIGQKLENLKSRWDQAYNTSTFWTTYPGLPFESDGLDSIQLRKKIYQKYVKDYLRCGEAIDENIGKILNYLETSGLAENTVVIYTSDQGYFLGEHGFFDKRMMYEESARMPFVICYPKEIKGGTRINDLILNIDFPALFADYAGIKKPSYMQGESFRKNLMGETPKNWRKSMYYRYWQHGVDRPAHFGIRDSRYKLIFYYGDGLDMTSVAKESTAPAWEFYDLEKDPQELHNAYHDPENYKVIVAMKKELLKQKDKAGDFDANRPKMKEIISKNWN